MWRRAKAVLGIMDGMSAEEVAGELSTSVSTVNRWVQWYNRDGLEGLRPKRQSGRPPKLTNEQKAELGTLVEAGPQAANYQSGVWVAAMIADLIYSRFGVQYHPGHVTRLLHQIGFSVQRPRKRLARADHEAQELWIRKRLPSIKKKPQDAAA